MSKKWFTFLQFVSLLYFFFFRTMSLQELLQQLELEDDMKIPASATLTIEKMIYWNSFINYVKELEEENDMVPLVINLISCINRYNK